MKLKSNFATTVLGTIMLVERYDEIVTLSGSYCDSRRENFGVAHYSSIDESHPWLRSLVLAYKKY